MPLIRKPVDRAPEAEPTAAEALKALTAGTAEERWAAARAAVDVPGGAQALGHALLTEADPRVREVMFTSLTRLSTAQSVEAILPLLRADDAGLRTGAFDAMRAMASVARGHLPLLLNDRDSDVRLLSCEIARGLPSGEATQLLCDLLEREQELNVCAAAIEVLTEVGTAQALPVLAQCQSRFPQAPFLAFAIKIATDRILSQSANAHD